MADHLSREERVAAGLRKLKEFQQKKGQTKKGQTTRKKNPQKPVSKSSEVTDQASESSHSLPATENSELIEEARSDLIVLKEVGSGSASTRSSTPSICDGDVAKCDKDLTTSANVSNSASPTPTNQKELSSTESLLQISQQLNGLMSESHAFLNGSIDQDDAPTVNKDNSVLERRNQELASQLDSVRQSNDHLHFQMQELKAKISRLQNDFEKERQELAEKSLKEQTALKDQLQVHIQTIGILVAEKTELQSALSLSQQTAKQKAVEVEELQGRLRASRQRANDLEKELNSVSMSKQQFEKGSKVSSKEIDRLKMDNYKLNKSSEELKHQNAELTEKISRKITECQNLESELADTRSKLSLAEIYAQQLSEKSSPESSSQIEELHHQKLELEKRISMHKDSLEKLIIERDQMSEQYQLYIQQLSQQVTSLRDELKQIRDEKESLSREKNELTEKLESLEKETQKDADEFDSKSEDKEEMKKEWEAQIASLESQVKGLKLDLESQVSDNMQMSKLVEEKEERILDLETFIKRRQDEEIDKNRLLETIQSDKVAASRAMAQNMELKRQLAELQNGFIALSNDKLELTQKFQAEHHITNELGERLSQQEEELHELKEQLAHKDEQLQKMHNSQTKGMYQQSQIADRMRHYEAQGQLAEMLQQELSQAKERIDVLVNQNTELRMSLAQQAEATLSSETSNQDKDAIKRNDMVASLSASVRQLEMERNQMMKQLEEQKLTRAKLEEQMKDREDEITSEEEESKVPKEEHEMMKNAMKQLEGRFKKTMDEIAELSEEKQRLEHLVLQLQSETETIGDYIALYQIQRGLMRKRASEKDEYIVRLAKDREDMKAKLGELQNLVINMLEERKQYQKNESSEQNLNGVEHDILLERLQVTDAAKLAVPDSEVLPNEPEAIENLDKSENTAKKIIELLTEIESTNLVEKTVKDNFHPCPVCSGRLITV